jgi:hypothetical protein
MPILPAKRWSCRRHTGGRVALRAEDGFLMIEVIISALLVGMIVIATFTGFDFLGRSSAEQRRHNEAAVLASESQEQLRSDSATTLLALEGSGHSYTRPVGGTTYTITQKATFGNGSSTTGCSASEEGTKGKGTYILVSSSVTWPRMIGKGVTESSVITPPTGSALDVEVTNGETPTSGVTLAITYTAVESSGTTTLEATTGSAGCVLFAGIPATSATLQVRETAGIVNKQGTLSWPTEELTLAPNVLTNHQVVLAPGGAIEATFAYEGKAKYKHKQNDPTKAEIEEEVKGDTFVAYNAEMKEPPPDFQTGSNQTLQNFPGGVFEVLPATSGAGYKPSATTQVEPIKYPKGNLFPFPSGKNWTVYAGDCTANDPEELTESLSTKVTDPTVLVPPAEKPEVAVPMTYVLLNVYNSTTKTLAQVVAEGANAWKYLETGATSYPVTITNVKCAGVTPNNETTIKNKHVQATTTGSIWGGHLEIPFQPYGEYELCLFAGGKTYKPKKAYKNLVAATKTTVNVNLGEKSKAEKESARVASEKETKEKREGEEATAKKKEVEKEEATQTKRETEEAPARTKREKEEKTEKETKEKEEATKATRLANEKAEKTKWESEEKAKPQKVTEKQRKEKEATQTTNRKAAEKTEQAATEKREKEETTTKTTRTTEEANKKKAEEKETTTEQTRIKNEETARKAAETKEGENKTKAITKENEEVAAQEVTVESGQASC